MEAGHKEVEDVDRCPEVQALSRSLDNLLGITFSDDKRGKKNIGKSGN